MFELPEIAVLGRQLRAEIAGRTIVSCVRGNSPHKFVFYNLAAPEYEANAAGRVVGPAQARAKWLFVPFEPGFVQLLGEFGGRLTLHPPGAPRPERHHLLFELDDGRAVSVFTQMWGMFSLATPTEAADHKYAGNIGLTPVDPGFTAEYFEQLVASQAAGPKRSAKGLLTQEGIIPGLGNAYCQDILFLAGIHPKRDVAGLDAAERGRLYRAILAVVNEAIAKGGRDDEHDLYGRRGGYVRRMDASMTGMPCTACGTPIVKMQYLGGACYFCPTCQPL